MWMAAMAPQALHTAPQTQSAPTRLEGKGREGKGRGGPVAARYIADVISDARSIAECIWVKVCFCIGASLRLLAARSTSGTLADASICGAAQDGTGRRA